MSDCVFCKIINKEIPAFVVYEDANVIAILPKDMEVYGHTLVIPKTHYQDIFAIPETSLAEIMTVVKKLSQHYTTSI